MKEHTGGRSRQSRFGVCALIKRSPAASREVGEASWQ